MVLQISKGQQVAGKQRSGAAAGRPSTGPFRRNTATLTIRMQKDLREQLQELADRHETSLGQEVQWAANRWVQDNQAAQSHVRGLSRAIVKITEQLERETGEPFKNAYTGDQLRMAVASLLFHLSPEHKGAPVPKRVMEAAANVSPEFRKSYVEYLGESVAGHVIARIETARTEEEARQLHPEHWRLMDPEGYSEIRRDLKGEEK
jgi:hypothetical protein